MGRHATTNDAVTADRVLIHTKIQSADETEQTNRPADSSRAAI